MDIDYDFPTPPSKSAIALYYDDWLTICKLLDLKPESEMVDVIEIIRRWQNIIHPELVEQQYQDDFDRKEV